MAERIGNHARSLAMELVLRGAENVEYKYVVKVLDTCRAAKLTNIAFATNRPEKDGAGQ